MKRCISKDMLCFPYLASKVLCIRWSLQVVLIFYHTLGFLVFFIFLLSSLRVIYHVIFLRGPTWDEALGGHIYAILGCKADSVVKGQKCTVF